MGSTKKTIAYRFDSVGNRIGMTDPDGGRFTYAYDAVNRISHLVNPQGERTTYGYDAAGRRSVKKLANGTRASFTYDAAGNLTTLANLKSDNTVISSFDYGYDRMGNRTSVVEADGSRVTWTYDATYQLTGEHRTGSHPYEDSYSYDAAGNRLLKIHDGARTTSSYDAANQIRWSEDASGRTSYTFDANGNQTGVEKPNGDRTTTSWDYENRTTLVEEASGIRNTMAYEPGGLRVKLEESTGTKKFVWDEQNYLAETDENDDTQVVYTNEPRVYGNLVSQRRGSDSHWYHFDAIGSTRELTDDSGSVTDTRLYDAWGNVLATTGVTPFSFEYVGQLGYFSDAQGRIFVRSRTYLARTARWSSLATCVGRMPDCLSPLGYIYAAASPIVFVAASGAVAQRGDRNSSITKSECEATVIIARTFDPIKAMEAAIEEADCEETTVLCEECGGVTAGGFSIRDGKPTIVMCFDKVDADVTDAAAVLEEFKSKLWHEFVHALDTCNGLVPFTDATCRQLMCGEARAYSCSNQCASENPGERQRCLLVRMSAVHAKAMLDEICPQLGAVESTRFIQDILREEGCTCDEPCEDAELPPLPEWLKENDNVQ